MAFNAGEVKFAAIAPVIGVQVLLFGEDCHWMLPVLPVNETVVVVPEQIVAVPVAVPATEVGLTVIKPEILEVAVPQVPVTTQ